MMDPIGKRPKHKRTDEVSKFSKSQKWERSLLFEHYRGFLFRGFGCCAGWFLVSPCKSEAVSLFASGFKCSEKHVEWLQLWILLRAAGTARPVLAVRVCRHVDARVCAPNSTVGGPRRPLVRPRRGSSFPACHGRTSQSGWQGIPSSVRSGERPSRPHCPVTVPVHAG